MSPTSYQTALSRVTLLTILLNGKDKKSIVFLVRLKYVSNVKKFGETMLKIIDTFVKILKQSSSFF